MEIQMTDKNGIRLLTENKMVKENIEIIPVFDELEIVQTPGSSTTAVMSQKASSNLFANSLKGEKNGAAVTVDDIAENSIAVVNLRSENLIPYPYIDTTKTVNGITFTDNGDGSITVNGTATTLVIFDLAKLYNLSEGQYVLSGAATGALIELYKNGVWETLIAATSNAVIRLEDGDKITGLTITIMKGQTINNLTVHPKLQKGTVATPYTRYVADDTPITVKSCGKNLLRYPYPVSTVTQNGITFTDNGDGSVTVKGTATNSAYFDLKRDDFIQPPTGVPIVLCGGIGEPGAADRVTVLSRKNNVNGENVNFLETPTPSWATATGQLAEGESIASISIYIPNGNTVDTTIYPQLEYGTTATAYEPYIEGETIETTLADGAQLDSIAPNMTITTDNNGIMLDVEYKRDTNIAFEKLEKRLLSLETAIATT